MSSTARAAERETGSPSETSTISVKRPKGSRRWPLIIAGTSALGGGYVAPLGIAAGYGVKNQGGWFALPIAGPWVYLGAREGCSSGEERDVLSRLGCAFDGVVIFGAVMDGLIQVTGAILIGAGMSGGDDAAAQTTAHRVRPFATYTGRDGFGGLSVSF